MKFNIEKLTDAINDKNSVSEEELLIRELLELCDNRCRNYQVGSLSKFNYKIFKCVYDELFKSNHEDMLLIKDMVKVEFLSENINYLSAYEDNEDEIY